MFFRRIILIVAIFLAPLVVFSPAAFATTLNRSQGNISAPAGGLFCAISGTPTQMAQAQAAQNLLPLNRWGSVSASQYTDLPGGLFSAFSSGIPQVMSDLTGSILGIGNSFWGISDSLSQIAQSFCFSTGAGAAINSLTATIWSFLSQGAILGVVILIGLVMIVLRLRKGGRIHEFLRFAIIIVVMIGIGYQSSRPVSASGNYPVLSPAWMVNTVFSATGAIVNAPLNALVSATTGSYKNAPIGQVSSTPAGISCASYEASLLNGYQKATGSTALTQSTAVVPEIMSNIWDNSGLAADGIAQFGSNGYASTVACHLYDSKANIASVNQVQDTMNALAADHNGGGLHYGSPTGRLVKPSKYALAFPGPNSSTQTLNESMVGWAACVAPGSNVLEAQPGWSSTTSASSGAHHIAPTIGAVKSGNFSTQSSSSTAQAEAVTNASCLSWWTTPGTSWASSSPLNIQNSQSFITQSYSPQAASFLIQIDGFGQGGSSMFTSVAYLISSFIVMIIFGLLDLAVIVAKFGILIMMIMLLFFLLVDVLPTSRKGHTMKFVKRFVGFLVLAVGAEAVLGLVALLTSVIDTFGSGVAHGSGMDMLWVSISPIAAVLGLHLLFKTLKVPSPFRPDSAMAYAGALGGGSIIGAEMFSKLNNRAVSRGKSFARRQGSKLAPGGKDRIGGPKGANKDGKSMPAKKSRPPKSNTPPNTSSGTAPDTGSSSSTPPNTSSGTAPNTGSSTPPDTGSAPDAGAAPTRGKMFTPEEMRLNAFDKHVAKNQRRKDAKQYSKTLYGSNMLARAKTKTVMRGKLAVSRAKANPVKTAAKAAAYGAVLMTAPIGLPLTALALGSHYAFGKARQARRERPKARHDREQHLQMAEREVYRLDAEGVEWRKKKRLNIRRSRV